MARESMRPTTMVLETMAAGDEGNADGGGEGMEGTDAGILFSVFLEISISLFFWELRRFFGRRSPQNLYVVPRSLVRSLLRVVLPVFALLFFLRSLFLRSLFLVIIFVVIKLRPALIFSFRQSGYYGPDYFAE